MFARNPTAGVTTVYAERWAVADFTFNTLRLALRALIAQERWH